jgi:hypothetical protein
VLTEAATSSLYYPWPMNKHGARNYVRAIGQVRRNTRVVKSNIKKVTYTHIFGIWKKGNSQYKVGPRAQY